MNQQDLDKIYTLNNNPNAIVVHTNQLSPLLSSCVTEACKNSSDWHKFVVTNVEALKRELILKTIIDFVHPLDLFPVCFTKKTQAYFLARYCADAILKLMENRLFIPNPMSPSKPLQLMIVINQVPNNLVKAEFLQPVVLTSILKRRYNANKKSLDLSRFHTDPGLKEFCLLSQPKLLLYVLQYVFDMKQPLSKIILCNNFLKTIDPIRVLSSLNIQSIDLRHNDLPNIDAIEALKHMKKLTILKLDGNPLCDLYSDINYVAKLKQLCPSLETIDEVTVFYPNGFYVPKNNFLCNISGADLVNQFIEHFFTVYDFEDRSNIADLYHKNAIFSLTSTVIHTQNSTSTPKLTHYQAINRNLISYTKYKYSNTKYRFLYQGVENIMKLLKTLPQTVHDPLQFQCDLIYYTSEQAILVVNGVFQEANYKVGFTRTFVLLRESDNVYTIVNDQLSVYNALNCQLRFFQKYPENVNYSQDPLPYYNRQYWELRETVRAITNLNYDYSQRFLETFHYDLKSVISNFLDLYMYDEIPPEAFIEPRTEPMLCPKIKRKVALPHSLINKIKQKYGTCTLGTAWQMLNEDRLLATLKVTNPSGELRDMLERRSGFEQIEARIEVVEIADDSDNQQNTREVGKDDVVEVVPGPSQGTIGGGAPSESIPAIGSLIQGKRRQGIMSKRKRSFNKKKMTKNVAPPLQSGTVNAGTQNNPQQPGICIKTVASQVVTQPIQPVQAVQPVQAIKPVQPIKTVQPMHPVQPMQRVQPMQSIQPMQHIQPMQLMQPMQPILPMQPIQPMQPIHPLQLIQPVHQPIQSIPGKVNQKPPTGRRRRKRKRPNAHNVNMIKQLSDKPS